MVPEVGKSVYVQSFKHDGSLHRTWCRAFVIEADEKHYVAVTHRAWVIEADGRKAEHASNSLTGFIRCRINDTLFFDRHPCMTVKRSRISTMIWM